MMNDWHVTRQVISSVIPDYSRSGQPVMEKLPLAVDQRPKHSRAEQCQPEQCHYGNEQRGFIDET